jgi:hypothetical protein
MRVRDTDSEAVLCLALGGETKSITNQAEASVSDALGAFYDDIYAHVRSVVAGKHAGAFRGVFPVGHTCAAKALLVFYAMHWQRELMWNLVDWHSEVGHGQTGDYHYFLDEQWAKRETALHSQLHSLVSRRTPLLNEVRHLFDTEQNEEYWNALGQSRVQHPEQEWIRRGQQLLSETHGNPSGASTASTSGPPSMYTRFRSQRSTRNQTETACDSSHRTISITCRRSS